MPTPQQQQDALAVLLRLKGQPDATGLGYAPTPLFTEDNTPYGQQQRDQLDARIAADHARQQKREDAFMAVSDANIPDMKRESDAQLADKIALASAPANAAAAGSLAVEKEKNAGAIALRDRQAQQTKDLMESLGGRGGSADAGAPGSFKPAINANGGVSFTQNQMPALVVRAKDQLSDAANKTDMAIAEMERLYPGITASAHQADQGNVSPGWGSFLTGGGPKYGNASDMAGAVNERLKYTLGLSSPYSDLAQASSFGNIEQMAGQLPGVRGLATITPLFKEHQSRWGKEAPLATAQRLLHMRAIMADTLRNIQGGDGAVEGPAVDPTDLGADWGGR